MHLMHPLFETRAYRYANGGLDLVPSKHPYLDPGRFQRLNGQLNVVLEFVFDASYSQEFKVSLKIVEDGLEGGISVFELRAGFLIAVKEIVNLGLGEDLFCDDEGAKAFTG